MFQLVLEEALPCWLFEKGDDVNDDAIMMLF